MGSYCARAARPNNRESTIFVSGLDFISLYPNPSSGSFDIRTSSDIKIKEILIFDLLGNQVNFTGSILEPDEYHVDANLTPGTYIVSLWSDTNNIYYAKLFITK